MWASQRLSWRTLRRLRSSSSAIAALLLAVSVSPPATADPGEWLLALEARGSLYSGGAVPSVGGGGELAVSVGLTDLFWLGLGGGLTGLAQGPFRGHGLGHIALLFDVFRTVPFVELGFGLDVYDGRSSPLLRLSAGADYLLDPDWALGVALRYQPALGEETEHLFDLGLRLVLRLPD